MSTSRSSDAFPTVAGTAKWVGSAGRRNRTGMGYAYLHHAVDDHSRPAYSEILDDERKDTAADFWRRAHAFFGDHGITVKRVLTDNGNCYRSKTFANAFGEDIAHKRTRPYRPQTNGKVERFNRTLATEWAQARTPRLTAQVLGSVVWAGLLSDRPSGCGQIPPE